MGKASEDFIQIQLSSNYIAILKTIIDNNTFKLQDDHDEIEFRIVSTQEGIADRTLTTLFRSFNHKLV